MRTCIRIARSIRRFILLAQPKTCSTAFPENEPALRGSYAPLFEKLERELEVMRSNQNVVDRAKALLAKRETQK